MIQPHGMTLEESRIYELKEERNELEDVILAKNRVIDDLLDFIKEVSSNMAPLFIHDEAKRLLSKYKVSK